MKILRLLLEKKNPETYELERDAFDFKESLSNEMKYQVQIRTTADKINSYYAGLQFARNFDEFPVAKYGLIAGQWQAIGYQYKKAGENYLAALAYITSLNALLHCPTDEMFTEEQKSVWLKEVREALRNLCDLKGRP